MFDGFNLSLRASPDVREISQSTSNLASSIFSPNSV